MQARYKEAGELEEMDIVPQNRVKGKGSLRGRFQECFASSSSVCGKAPLIFKSPLQIPNECDMLECADI